MLDVASNKIDRFGWERMDATVKKSLLNDWVSALEPYELPEVVAGIDRVFRDKKGEVRALNEYQVIAAINSNRAEELASLPKSAPEPEKRKRATKEEADAICEARGYTPKRFK